MSSGKARAKEGLDKDLFAQIVAQTSECGGFSTLLADLLHEQVLDKKSLLQSPALQPYRQGLCQTLVEGPKLKSSVGHRFSALIQPCEEWDETLLLAVNSKAGGVLLNPGPAYIVGPSDAGVIVCAKDKVASAVKDIEKGIPLPIDSKNESGSGNGGGYSFHSVAAPVSLRDAHINNIDDVCLEGGHVLVGGNLDTCGILPQLIKNLRRDYFPLRKIVLLEPAELRDDLWERISTFPEVYFLLGNATEAADLRRAGAERAHSVILLSPWNEEQKKKKGGKKGNTTGDKPYTSIMKVQQVLKDELQSAVRPLLCIGKNHTGTGRELKPAEREFQVINHPLHAASLMMSYDLFDYWLTKALSSKKGVLGQVAEQLIRGVVQSVPASQLQALVCEDQPDKPLTAGELIRYVGSKGFLPLGYYHWTGSEEGSYVHTHPEKEHVLAGSDRVVLLWPRGEVPTSLPLPSPALSGDAANSDRLRAETFDLEYVPIRKAAEVCALPAPASVLPGSAPLARPPPPLSLPPSLSLPPALHLPPTAPPASGPAPPVEAEAPPPPPPRDEGDDLPPAVVASPRPPPTEPSPRQQAPSPRQQPPPPGESLVGFSPRLPPASGSPRVAVPPRPILASSPSSSSSSSPRDLPHMSSSLSSASSASSSPRPAVSPRLPPAVSPRQPPPPAVSPRPPPPAAPPRDPPSSPALDAFQPSLPPTLALQPTLKPPPSLTLPPARNASPGKSMRAEEPAIPAFATVRRPTTNKNRRTLTSLHRTISSSSLSRLQQQAQEDEEESLKQHQRTAVTLQKPVVSPRASAPPISRPPPFTPPSSGVSSPPPLLSPTSALPPVFTPPPKFTPAPRVSAAASPRPAPALVPPPVLTLPPTLVPPPSLSLPPSTSSSSTFSTSSPAPAPVPLSFNPNAWSSLGTNPYPSLRGEGLATPTIPGPPSASPSTRPGPPPSLAPPPSLQTPPYRP